MSEWTNINHEIPESYCTVKVRNNIIPFIEDYMYFNTETNLFHSIDRDKFCSSKSITEWKYLSEDEVN